MSVWGGDKPELLGRSLSSIVAQSRPPAETIIIIDGAINQGLAEEIRKFSIESGIETVTKQTESNKGLWHARNLGIVHSRHNVIALHDADDVMHPRRLELQLQQLLDEQLDVLCSPSVEFATGNLMIVGIRDLPLRTRRGAVNLRVINPLSHSSVMIRKEAVLAVGGYRNLVGVEDLDLWRRLNWEGKRFGSTDVVLQALGSDGALLRRRKLTLTLFLAELRLMAQSIRCRGKQWLFVELAILAVRLGYRALPPRLMRAAQALAFRKSPPDKSPSLQAFMTRCPTKVAQC